MEVVLLNKIGDYLTYMKKHPRVIQKIFPSGKEVISAYRFDGKVANLYTGIVLPFHKMKLEPLLKWFTSKYRSLLALGPQYCWGSSNEAGKVMGLQHWVPSLVQ